MEQIGSAVHLFLAALFSAAWLVVPLRRALQNYGDVSSRAMGCITCVAAQLCARSETTKLRGEVATGLRSTTNVTTFGSSSMRRYST